MRYLVFILVLITLSSCSTVMDIFDENKFYYKSGYQRVQIDTEDENIKNSHPVKIDPSKIEGALKLVLTNFSGRPQQLFPNEKVRDYADAISEALVDAQPNQDIVFTIEGWYKQKGLSANRVTSGRMFYNKSGLNLVFGSIMRKGNMHDTDPMLASGINDDLKNNPYVPGSRFQTIRSKFKLSALPNSGVFRPAVAKGRGDWLIFSTKALQARSNLNRQQQSLALRSNIGVEDLRNEVQNLKRELRSIRNPYSNQNGRYGYNNYPPNNYPPNQYPPNYRQTPYNMNVQSAYPYPNYPNPGYYQQNPGIQQNSNIQRNELSIKSLESMRERGLISEESYFKKLKELGY